MSTVCNSLLQCINRISTLENKEKLLQDLQNPHILNRRIEAFIHFGSVHFHLNRHASAYLVLKTNFYLRMDVKTNRNWLYLSDSHMPWPRNGQVVATHQITWNKYVLTKEMSLHPQ